MDNITHIDREGRRTRRPASIRIEGGMTVGDELAIRLRALRIRKAGLDATMASVQAEINEVLALINAGQPGGSQQ